MEEQRNNGDPSDSWKLSVTTEMRAIDPRPIGALPDESLRLGLRVDEIR
jgi:hypothetical protein